MSLNSVLTILFGLSNGEPSSNTSCGGELSTMNINELMAALNKPAEDSCSNADTLLFNVSIAQANFIPLLTLLGLWIYRKVI